MRKIDYRDHDVIVTLWSREQGKVGVLVRGARKTQHRYTSVVQLYAMGRFVIRPSGSLYTLQHGERLQTWKMLSHDVVLLAYVAMMIEWVDQLLPEGDAPAWLYDQLVHALVALDGGSPPTMIASVFALHTFGYAGVAPAVHQCVACGAVIHPLSAQVGWSVRGGGIVCARCLVDVAHAIDDLETIPYARVALLQKMMRADIAMIGTVRVSAQTEQWLQAMVWRWFDVHTTVQPRARTVLQQLLKDIVL